MVEKGIKIAAWCMLGVAMSMAVVSTGCISGNDSVVADVFPRGWEAPVSIVYTSRDTLTERRVTLFLRHDSRTRSGRYVVGFYTPSGTVARLDTLSVEIDERQTPAVSMNIKWPYRRIFRFVEQGDYRIIVTPVQNTLGVWSVGMDFD